MTTFQKKSTATFRADKRGESRPSFKKKSKNLNANLVKRQKNHHVQLLSH